MTPFEGTSTCIETARPLQLLEVLSSVCALVFLSSRSLTSLQTSGGPLTSSRITPDSLLPFVHPPPLSSIPYPTLPSIYHTIPYMHSSLSLSLSLSSLLDCVLPNAGSDSSSLRLVNYAETPWKSNSFWSLAFLFVANGVGPPSRRSGGGGQRLREPRSWGGWPGPATREQRRRGCI